MLLKISDALSIAKLKVTLDIYFLLTWDFRPTLCLVICQSLVIIFFSCKFLLETQNVNEMVAPLIFESFQSQMELPC